MQRGFLVVGASVAVVALAGCQAPTDRAAIAVAKCYVPVSDAVHTPADQSIETSDVAARDLGGGDWEVTGVATLPESGGSWDYRCVVTPDASDTLRGLRVVTLEVTPHGS